MSDKITMCSALAPIIIFVKSDKICLSFHIPVLEKRILKKKNLPTYITGKVLIEDYGSLASASRTLHAKSASWTKKEFVKLCPCHVNEAYMGTDISKFFGTLCCWILFLQVSDLCCGTFQRTTLYVRISLTARSSQFGIIVVLILFACECVYETVVTWYMHKPKLYPPCWGITSNTISCIIVSDSTVK